MSEPTITCPNCKSQIKLTESLAAPLIREVRARYQERIAEKEAYLANREAAIREQQSELAKAKTGIEQRVADAKADLLRKERELDDARRGINLTIETKVQESLAEVRERARRESDEVFKLRLKEKENAIARIEMEFEEERKRISLEEAEKARIIVAANLDRKAKEVS
jgi:hypothetical protein